MITAFSDFSEALPPAPTCILVSFEGGRFGGEASFLQCGGSRFTNIGVASGETTDPYCIESGTLTTIGDIVVSILGPC